MSEPYKKLFLRTAAGIKPGLEVISALLEALDNPHQKLAVIHVAGTNGKGSVCAMIESVLRASGFKTGLYTSPHLIRFSERFRINGEEISEEKLNDYIRALEKTADKVEASTGLRGATFFEISTALAFQYFAAEKVDIAIIETGMGGRWDATNVVIPLLSVITHIDIDHTNFLGNTLEKIAAEKAGIIKPGRPVVSAPQSDAAMGELEKTGVPIIASAEAVSVNRIGAPQKLKIETHSQNLPPINLPLLGGCQRENVGVAVAALEVFSDIVGVELAFKKGLETVEWGARFQTLETEPLIILDGAHNPSAGRALADTLKELYPTRQIGFIVGFLDDKESVEFLRELKPLVSKAWTVGIDAPRGTSAEQAALQCKVAGIDAEARPVAEAWSSAKRWASEANRLVIVTGSLYLKSMLEMKV
ncbi:bifunctional folylpolyglutamate synthase/dihydrofolate synthase [Pontiella agarivorans]|uniref:Dihydrofolate synthase/folylpolyglutamate synthase n=1 Tax=Pontiella agarivorans TaxID=3038953 RepID=A0ABU5MXW0_9BACT|nr:folylpolyglutamate synthase/dihydrofolate synthase family protein [Pontiella agarivorans]MDZ8119048.1 bifunctional folylpolyglutamate synthase/dihydrofolate synthase [Pontiella agarivorans]